MPYNFVPDNATSLCVVYGIEDGLSDYILQDVNVHEDVITVQIPDQKGAIAQVFPFQHHWTVSFTAIGKGEAPVTVGDTQEIGGINYYVQTCERRATYNDTQKWSVTMEAWDGTAVSGDASPLGPVQSGGNG